MKYLLIITTILLSKFCYSQQFYNRTLGTTTPNDPFLSSSRAFYMPRSLDTTLNGGLDTIGALMYDRIRAKLAVRDTVLAGGHKFTFLFKQDDTTNTLATKYDLTQLPQTILNNIGSGFRLAATPSGNIKTIFGSNTITLDSSSNSNALTFKADTSVLATQYDLTQITSGINQLTGDVTAGPGSGSQAASFRFFTGLSLLGRSASSSGVPAEITATSDFQVMRRSGSSIAFGAVNINSDNAVTGLLKNANIDTFNTFAPPSTLGRIFYDTAFASLSDFIPTGGPTIAISNAKIAVTNAVASDAAQVSVKKYRATNLHHWTFRARARATNRVIGFGPGLMSIYPGDNSGFHDYVTTSGGTGFAMRSAVSGTTLASGSGPTVNTNDILEFVLTRDDSVITSTVRNITTSSSTFSISKTYTAVSGGTLLPNDGYIHWVSFGDNFEIISQDFSSTEIKTPTGLVLGDSKSEGYYSGTFVQRYWTTLNSTYPNVVLEAGGGNKLSGVYNKIDELYALNPEWVLISDLGRNDIAAGMTLAQFQIMFADVYTKLSRGGQTRVFICMMPEDTTSGGSAVGLTAVHQWLANTYPNNYISGVWDTLSTSNVLNASFNSGDNIHINAAGNVAIATKLINSGYLTTISTKRRTPFIANDDFISFTGNTLHAAFDSRRVANYVWRSDTSNNLMPSLIHDDGTQLVISTSPISQTIGISAAKVNVDGAIYASGLSGFLGIRDRTTTDVFGNIAQSGVFQVLVNGIGKWFLDANGLMAVGVNPVITGRARAIFNIWEDRSFVNTDQSTKGIGFNLDSNTYTGNSSNTVSNLNNASIFPMKLQGTGSTTFITPASLYIEGPPYAGASTTVTNPYSLNVNSGNVRLGAADSVGTATGGYLFRDASTGILKLTQSGAVTTLYTGDGTLTSDRIVTGGANGLTVTSSRTGTNSTIIVSNSSSGRAISASSTSGIAIHGSSAGVGVLGISSGTVGLWGESSASQGLYALSTATRAADIVTSVSSTNDVQPIASFYRLSQSAGANNIGGSINIEINNTTGAGSTAVGTQFISQLTTATAGAEVSRFKINLLNAGSLGTVATFDGNANVTFGTTNSIVGTATNNDAVTGNIGEEVSSYLSTYTNYTTTATYQAIDSITLTAGDWDIAAFGTFSSNGATITAASDAIFVISTTIASATGATEGKNIAYVPQATLLGTSHESISIAPYRVSLSSTTKYYFNTQATFTIGNPQFAGGLRARRVR